MMYDKCKFKCKWCNIIHDSYDEQKVFITENINFNNYFINSFLTKNLDKTKNFAIFYENTIYSSNIKVEEDISLPNKKINSCISKLVSKNNNNKYSIFLEQDINLVFIGTSSELYSLRLKTKENTNIDLNILFINLDLGSRITLKIDKDISKSSRLRSFWSSINSIYSTYEDYQNQKKKVVFTNDIFVNNNNYLSDDSSIEENYNFGFQTHDILLDNNYFSGESKNTSSITKYLSFPVRNYILQETKNSLNGEDKTIFRGFYLKEFKQNKVQPNLDIEIFSNMEEEKNLALQDTKIIAEEPCILNVKTNLMAKNETQEGEHSYSFKQTILDDESMFFLTIIGINKVISKFILLSSMALDSYYGDYDSFTKEYYERFKLI